MRLRGCGVCVYTESCEDMHECMQMGLLDEEIPPWEYLGVFSGEGPFGSLPGVLSLKVVSANGSPSVTSHKVTRSEIMGAVYITREPICMFCRVSLRPSSVMPDMYVYSCPEIEADS